MRDLVVLLAALVLWVGLMQVPNLGLAGFVPAQTAWDTIFENDPDNTDTVSEGDDHIRQTKTLIRNRAEVEHGWGTGLGEGTDDTGRHREGSAQCFYQAGAPTDLVATDTAGLTALDATDDGRCWIDSDNGTLSHWTGAAWDAKSSGVGKHTIWVPAGAMRAASTNPASGPAQIELVAQQPELEVYDFDTAADEHVWWTTKYPKNWDLGDIEFRVFWTVNGAVATGVAWSLQSVSRGDNEAIATAYGTPTVVTDDAQGAANEMLVTAISGAHTIGGTPALGEMVWHNLLRDVSDANDDMAEDARLMGVEITYTTDAPTDD